MGLGDDVLTAISSIHAAGLDVEKWPRALSVIADLVGGVGGTLEIIQRPSMRHRALYSHGLAPVDAYLEYYASVSPRLPYAFRQPAGSLLYDAQYIDDAGIDAHPFFMEFLAPHDLRCFLGGAGDEAILSESDEYVVRVAKDELKRILGVTVEPIHQIIARWPRSMAQYTVGHAGRIRDIKDHVAKYPGLFLAGNAYEGIGLPDCVRLGRAAAKAIIAG